MKGLKVKEYNYRTADGATTDVATTYFGVTSVLFQLMCVQSYLITLISLNTKVREPKLERHKYGEQQRAHTINEVFMPQILTLSNLTTCKTFTYDLFTYKMITLMESGHSGTFCLNQAHFPS